MAQANPSHAEALRQARLLVLVPQPNRASSPIPSTRGQTCRRQSRWLPLPVHPWVMYGNSLLWRTHGATG